MFVRVFCIVNSDNKVLLNSGEFGVFDLTVDIYTDASKAEEKSNEVGGTVKYLGADVLIEGEGIEYKEFKVNSPTGSGCFDGLL